MTLPVATLDHVIINARDDLDQAVDIVPARLALNAVLELSNRH